MIAGKRIGVALGGGGARGLCHIEFIKVLDELNLKPSIISGTSIGAIIGGFYAGGKSGVQMEELLERIGLKEISKMVDIAILSPSGLVKGKGVVEFLQRYLPVKTFEELVIPLKVVATDFWNREEVIFHSGDLIPAIRASISIPAVFKPVKINNKIFIDGGAVNPLPFDIIRQDCDFLIAIDVSGTISPSEKDQMPSMFESLMASFQIMESRFIKDKLRLFKPDIYVKPLLDNIQILDFHKQGEILSGVQEDVQEFKVQLYDLLTSGKKGKPQERKRFGFFPRKKESSRESDKI